LRILPLRLRHAAAALAGIFVTSFYGVAPAAAPATIDLPEFNSAPNDAITWDQLLRQTSNWRGTLWGKPDWADRPQGDDRFAWPTAPVPPPGASWKYNDVRVNALALAAMHAWREPLPAVLAREVMGPIGASDGWRWHGYDNSFVTLDGRVGRVLAALAPPAVAR